MNYTIPNGGNGYFNCNFIAGVTNASIIYEYGTYERRCRGTITIVVNSGQATSIGHASWIISAGPPGSLPTCSTLESANIVGGDVYWRVRYTGL